MFITAGGNLSWLVLTRGKSVNSYQSHKCLCTGLDLDSMGLKYIFWDSSLGKGTHSKLQIKMKCNSECVFRMRKAQQFIHFQKRLISHTSQNPEKFTIFLLISCQIHSFSPFSFLCTLWLLPFVIFYYSKDRFLNIFYLYRKKGNYYCFIIIGNVMWMSNLGKPLLHVL